MTSHAEWPILEVKVISTEEASPDNRHGDIAWVGISLSGDGFTTGLNVLLTNANKGIRIRDIDWIKL